MKLILNCNSKHFHTLGPCAARRLVSGFRQLPVPICESLNIRFPEVGPHHDETAFAQYRASLNILDTNRIPAGG